MSNDEQMRMMIGLQAHVQRLAGDIGERNVLHTAALNDAASYIESEWSRQGYAVSQLMYEISGVRCANLEVVRDGKARRRLCAGWGLSPHDLERAPPAVEMLA